jgi:hypothetical protein
MSMEPCPHEPTTVAYAYGEAPEDHALHVASCPACAEVLALHEAVAGSVPLSALATAPTARRRRRWPRVLLGAALAAAAAAVGLALLPDPPAPAPAPAPGLGSWGPTGAPEPLDAALDDIDLELASLELELL